MPTPEDKAREKIGAALEKAGWKVQGTKVANLGAGRGGALRNFLLTQDYGFSEDQFKSIDDPRNVVGTNLTHADSLRQSTLATAFSGRLLSGSNNEAYVNHRKS